MLYSEYLKKPRKCPFCTLKKEEIIRENKRARLILAKAPYTQDHLLIVPKRHIISFLELTNREEDSIKALQIFGLKLLKKKYENVSILMRDGKKSKFGKSIEHLHFHLIPNMEIGAIDINLNKRKLLDDKDYINKTTEIKATLSKKS